VIPTLARLLEPVRLCSAVPLHKTSIRNEQAYYSCILQVCTSSSLNCVTVVILIAKVTVQKWLVSQDHAEQTSAAGIRYNLKLYSDRIAYGHSYVLYE
jgi:hypothetical protein